MPGPAWLDPLAGLGLLLPVSGPTTSHTHPGSISTFRNSANKDTNLDEEFNCGENCIVPFCTLRFQISILGWWRGGMRQILLIGQDRGGGWITFSMLLSQLKASDKFVLSVNKWDSLCFTGGGAQAQTFIDCHCCCVSLSLLNCLLCYSLLLL